MSRTHVHRGAAQAAPVTAPHRCRFEPLGTYVTHPGGVTIPRASRAPHAGVLRASQRTYRCRDCERVVHVTPVLVPLTLLRYSAALARQLEAWGWHPAAIDAIRPRRGSRKRADPRPYSIARTRRRP